MAVNSPPRSAQRFASEKTAQGGARGRLGPSVKGVEKGRYIAREGAPQAGAYADRAFGAAACLGCRGRGKDTVTVVPASSEVVMAIFAPWVSAMRRAP